MAKNKNVQGTSCDDANFYCEYQCSVGEWVLIGRAHGSGYTCFTSLPGSCTEGGTTCVSPTPIGNAAAARVPDQNTGDYVYDGTRLHLLRSRTDFDHYCPPTLELSDLQGTKVGDLLEQAAQHLSFVCVTVNLEAVKKDDAS